MASLVLVLVVVAFLGSLEGAVSWGDRLGLGGLLLSRSGRQWPITGMRRAAPSAWPSLSSSAAATSLLLRAREAATPAEASQRQMSGLRLRALYRRNCYFSPVNCRVDLFAFAQPQQKKN